MNTGRPSRNLSKHYVAYPEYALPLELEIDASLSGSGGGSGDFPGRVPKELQANTSSIAYTTSLVNSPLVFPPYTKEQLKEFQQRDPVTGQVYKSWLSQSKLSMEERKQWDEVGPCASDSHEVKSRPIAKKTCGKCGRQHKYGECPAVGKTCRRCGRASHFECVCRTKLSPDGSNQWSNRSSKGNGEKSKSRGAVTGQFRRHQSTKRRSNEAKAGKEVHVLDGDSTTSDSEEDSHFSIDSVDSVDNKNETEDHWKVKLLVNGKKLSYKIDSGALPKKIYDKLHLTDADQIRRSNKKLVSYSGNSIKVLGQTTLLCELKGKLQPIKFHIL
ncbi:hypothetical protein HOLleu_15706 [Holothuria leucospilota]|uniref:Uncharacterized protein n=1 Tax=Holothuria leucospilota TaxID=206669 RepID=A0A9Q1C4Z3_HOLLE|nr:hypothetical protein HOLleu_15706 [Holothuria leucospilota]